MSDFDDPIESGTRVSLYILNCASDEIQMARRWISRRRVHGRRRGRSSRRGRLNKALVNTNINTIVGLLSLELCGEFGSL